MPKRLLPYVHRHEPRAHTFGFTLKSGLGGIVGMAVAGGLASVTELPFLLAPFGATAVLLFGQPASPLAQPANVLGGYLIATLVTAAMLMLPASWFLAAIGVGLVIALMLMLRVTHPPAGAIPILAATSPIGALTLAQVVMAGSVALIGVAALHHRLPPRQAYPRPRPID
jgi:CBS-domain-containing membrane protein